MMTNLDHTHPDRRDAGKDPAVVRDALQWMLKRPTDLLEHYGATRQEADKWRRDVDRLTDELLRKVERRN